MAEFLTPDICVIGGGAGGLATATRARALGASVVLIEKGPLGGASLNSAALPSKALVAAARRAYDLSTAAPFGIANAESVMSKSNDELLAKVYPKAKRTRTIKDNESLISIAKAREVLGYRPRYSWRKRVEAGATAKAKIKK